MFLNWTWETEGGVDVQWSLGLLTHWCVYIKYFPQVLWRKQHRHITSMEFEPTTFAILEQGRISLLC